MHGRCLSHIQNKLQSSTKLSETWAFFKMWGKPYHNMFYASLHYKLHAFITNHVMV